MPQSVLGPQASLLWACHMHYFGGPKLWLVEQESQDMRQHGLFSLTRMNPFKSHLANPSGLSFYLFNFLTTWITPVLDGGASFVWLGISFAPADINWHFCLSGKQLLTLKGVKASDGRV